MSIDLNDEIFQDFLIEAGEILEQLNEQLVTLESEPDNRDLLNSVFRSFHTIKGGAGFLAIDALVNVCHVAENVFDVLRNGQRSVDSNLMDVVLEVLDVVNGMFQQISEGSEPEAAGADLLSRLEVLSRPASAATVVDTDQQTTAETAKVTAPADNGEADEPSQNTVIPGIDPVPETDTNAASTDTSAQDGVSGEDITDEEFEALLDQLHGTGKHATAPVAGVIADATGEDSANISAGDVLASAGDEISEEEFEALLDELEAKKTSAGMSDNAGAAVTDKPAEQSPPAAVADEPKTDTAPAAAGRAPQQVKAETTVRVETSVLDSIMNMVGELVLLRNRLSNLGESIDNEEVTATVSNLDVVTTDLQASVMKTRMQPIKKVFGRFPRVVRDLARNLKKEVSLEMIGEETDLDKNLVEALSDPLVHLVRNSVDHGIEMPDEREAAGKPREGTVILSAEQEGDHILLTIADDGKGMDHEVLRRKAVSKGIMDEDAAARLDESDCYNLIFLPGFSTKEEISDVSGRGVGMDVVKTRINQLNGIINIDSTMGKGTTITIKVPLTLAIMPTLMVCLGEKNQTFALPLVNVSEIIEMDSDKINTLDGRHVMMVRGKPIPLFNLSRWLTADPYGQGYVNGHVVVVSVGNQNIALHVDRLMGREEVVIKPLGAMLQGTRGLAGATITGNGKIALILDLPDLVQSYAGRC